MRVFLSFLLLFAWQGEKISHTEKEWLDLLGPDRYRVMRDKGTEHAFLGRYTYFFDEGIYSCAACDLPLFSSAEKYNAGSGWPCFSYPISKENVYYLEDYSFVFKRYEVLCHRCDSHLGHIFNDGPEPKGFRFCVNSIALHFKKKKR